LFSVAAGYLLSVLFVFHDIFGRQATNNCEWKKYEENSAAA